MASDEDIQRVRAELAELSSDPARWETIDPELLCQFAFSEILRYGITSDEALVPDLMTLYSVVARRASLEQRQRLKDYVSEFLSGGNGSCNALMPFIFCDPSPLIVSSAALDLAVLMPLVDDDPLTGPRYLRYLAEDLTDDQGQRVGLLAGLLALGDSRTLPVLDGCWDLLDEQHRIALARIHRGRAFASAVTFYLDWLDACVGTGAEQVFATVAAGLARMGLHETEVVDFARAFPVWASDDLPAIRVAGQWTVAEYGQIIAPRLRSLHERESEPKVMQHVLYAWGVPVA